MPTPPATPSVHVVVARAAMARFDITLARPQNVTGPPAAAVNSRTAAGASPMPISSRRATSGISNSSGTLIRMPKVAAIAMPVRSLPRYVDTTSGLTHCIASPLAKPAIAMIGPIRTRNPKLARPHSVNASFIAGPHGSSMGS